MKDSRPLLLGHRGARVYAPENTLAAFELALAHGCDGFEFDVRLTADNRAVVCHDPRIARLDVASSKYETLALVRRAAAPAALHAALDTAAALEHRQSALPCLQDVLFRFHTRAFLYIELKVAGLESLVASVLRKYPPERGCVVASFLPEVIQAAHRTDSAIPLGYICDRKSDLARWKELPIDYVMLHYSLVSRQLMSELHAAQQQVMVWTVNRQAQMLAVAQAGADAILSDDTERLARTFRWHVA